MAFSRLLPKKGGKFEENPLDMQSLLVRERISEEEHHEEAVNDDQPKSNGNSREGSIIGDLNAGDKNSLSEDEDGDSAQHNLLTNQILDSEQTEEPSGNPTNGTSNNEQPLFSGFVEENIEPKNQETELFEGTDEQIHRSSESQHLSEQQDTYNYEEGG